MLRFHVPLIEPDSPDFPHPALGEGLDHSGHTDRENLPILRQPVQRFPRRLAQGEVLALGEAVVLVCPWRFFRRSFNQGSFPRRSLPASSVLRASPSSHTTRPMPSRSRRLRAACALIAGTSRVAAGVCACVPSPLPRRNPRALVTGRHHAALATRWRRPSPLRRWVGFRINLFEACSAFTHVTARMLAELLKQPFPSRASTVWLPARLSRLLPGAVTISRAGLSPARLQDLSSRRTT